MRFFSLRALFLLGFIVAMPVLALPSVARRIDNWLYGPPPADFGRAPVPPPVQEMVDGTAVSPVLSPDATANFPFSARPENASFSANTRSSVAPARLDEPSPAPQNLAYPTNAAAHSATPAGRFEPAIPPPLPASPPFAAADTPVASPEPKIDERTIARLQQIRERLEQLGAEYVLVDAQDSGRFRFHCRVLVDPHTRYVHSFNATSFDPLAAGEQVLNEVEKWRQAGASLPAASTP